MKKLMTLMLGMTLAFAIVAPTFAADGTAKATDRVAGELITQADAA